MQQNSPFFTVVVIACDVGKYLDKCVDSILAQTFDDFDVLIGVEESADDTANIADRLACGSAKIGVAKFSRSGSASRTRNFGIDNARGKYVLFVDGDDWIEPQSLQKFYDKIAEFGELDLIPAAASILLEDADGALAPAGEIFRGAYPDKLFTGEEYLLGVCPITKLRTATWMSAYRVDFLRAEKLYQPIGRRHQDDDWTPRVFVAAKRVAALKFAYYNYRKRAGSVTTKANPKSIRDISENVKSFLEYWRSGKLSDSLKPMFATWYIDYTYRFFVARSVRLYPRELRRQTFMAAVGDPAQFAVFCEIAARASKSKKLVLPIYRLARTNGFFGVAEFIFNKIYAFMIFKVWAKIGGMRGGK